MFKIYNRNSPLRSISLHTTITSISKEFWDKAASNSSPFLQYDFFFALEKSFSIGQNSGWIPLYFMDDVNQAILYAFVKNHSYGEYIFDWQWANAYKENGMSYYPKLTSMIPFTPVTTPHIIALNLTPEVAQGLLDTYQDLYEKNEFSSSHFLFTHPCEESLFQENGYILRESMQYHFFNEGYQSFEDFLSCLKGRKAKQIRKERLLEDIQITSFTGEDLTQAHAERMYHFYLSTIDHKNAIDYLKKDFFLLIFETMKKNVLYIEASQNGEAVAGSLFFYDTNKLYGRYWGCIKDIQYLHFELCYYQGIDFCIKNNLPIFEAGAQGEHKIPRGFKPIKKFSAHKIKNESFHLAIANFIEEESRQLSLLVSQLAANLPFK